MNLCCIQYPLQPYHNGDLGVTCHNHAQWWGSQAVAQSMLNPPNVAGWKGGRYWLTETNLLARWTGFIANAFRLLGSEGSSNSELMDRDLNQAYISQHLIELTNNSTDVEEVVNSIISFHFSCPLSDSTIEAAIVAFKGNIYPENYYTDGIWFLEIGEVWRQYSSLLRYLARLPEYQLT